MAAMSEVFRDTGRLRKQPILRTSQRFLKKPDRWRFDQPLKPHKDPKVRDRVRYAVVIEQAGNHFSAYVPDLPGCIATGATLETVETNIREAIEFHIDGLKEDGDQVPPPHSQVDYVEVGG